MAFALGLEMQCNQRGDGRLRGLVAGLLVAGLVLPRVANADPGLRLGLGLMFAASIPDGPSKSALGAPWYLRGEVRGISRVDPVGTVGDRPARGHVALYDSFFLEAGIGAVCTKHDCASLGDVHLRGVGGYELLGGYRSPEVSVFVGPRVSWEGWITAHHALGSMSVPLVVRLDHAVRDTHRRVFSAWGSPMGPFRSYGGQWEEPIARGLSVVTQVSFARAVIGPWKDDSDGALGVTASVGVRVGSLF